MSERKCCYFIEMETGCLVIGALSLLFAAGLSATSISFLALDAQNDKEEQTTHKLQEFLRLDMSRLSVDILLYIILVVSLLLFAGSWLLIIGVKKNKPGYVICYFGMSIITTILFQIGALLVLLTNDWGLSFIMFIISGINIYFFVVIYHYYDLQQHKPSPTGYDALEEELIQHFGDNDV